jgi:hypothetical protein
VHVVISVIQFRLLSVETVHGICTCTLLPSIEHNMYMYMYSTCILCGSHVNCSCKTLIGVPA